MLLNATNCVIITVIMLVITILSNNYNMYFLLRNIYSWQPKMIINYIINYITIQIITITIMIN